MVNRCLTKHCAHPASGTGHFVADDYVLKIESNRLMQPSIDELLLGRNVPGWERNVTKSEISSARSASADLAFSSKPTPVIFKRPAFFSSIAVPAPWLEWEGGRDRGFRK
jgi:hypothetical protein